MSYAEKPEYSKQISMSIAGETIVIGLGAKSIKMIKEVLSAGIPGRKIRVIEAKTQDNLHELSAEQYETFLDEGVEMIFGTTFVRVDQKYGRYITNHTVDFNTYNSEKVQEKIEQLNERRKEINRIKRRLRKENDYTSALEMDKELTGVKYSINRLHPDRTEKFFHRIVIAFDNIRADVEGNVIPEDRFSYEDVHTMTSDEFLEKVL